MDERQAKCVIVVGSTGCECSKANPYERQAKGGSLFDGLLKQFEAGSVSEFKTRDLLCSAKTISFFS